MLSAHTRPQTKPHSWTYGDRKEEMYSTQAVKDKAISFILTVLLLLLYYEHNSVNVIVYNFEMTLIYAPLLPTGYTKWA